MCLQKESILRETQHGVKISYGPSMNEHDTYVVYVPLQAGHFPKAFREAIEEAGRLLADGIANDCLQPGPTP